MFCFPNTCQEILFPSNSVLFTCISAHNQLRRKEKVSGSPRTSIGKTKHLGPRPAAPAPLRPHVSVFCLKTEFFFLRFGLLSTRIRWNASFQNALQSGDFKNAGFSFTCGQTNTMMPHILRFQLEACSVRVSVLTFSCGRAKAIRIRYVWMCILWKWRKWKNLWLFSKIPKISGYVWTGPKVTSRRIRIHTVILHESALSSHETSEPALYSLAKAKEVYL